jgi:hypothetical protein
MKRALGKALVEPQDSTLSLSTNPGSLADVLLLGACLTTVRSVVGDLGLTIQAGAYTEPMNLEQWNSELEGPDLKVMLIEDCRKDTKTLLSAYP